jgi:multisubunit Na+/H+ antiporter MnhG subunit
MTGQQVFGDVLLGLAVAVVLVSSVGILVMRDAFQKLHFVTPAAVLAPAFVGLAVLVRSGWSSSSAITWLAVLFLLIGGPYLAHATVRAAHIRETGDWRPRGRQAAPAEATTSPAGDRQGGDRQGGDGQAGAQQAAGDGQAQR